MRFSALVRWKTFPLKSKERKEERNHSGGTILRKISLKHRLIKKKEFYHIAHFPDSLDDTTHQPAPLTLFAVTDLARHGESQSPGVCDWQPLVQWGW